MNTSRRTFIKTSAVALAGTTLLSRDLFAAVQPEVLGLQLYSVRDDMKKDPMGTLKSVAAIGYKNVEHAGYSNRKFYGYAPKDFKKILDDLGLNMISGHVGFALDMWNSATNDFTDTWKYTVEDAVTAGQKFMFKAGLGNDILTDEAKLKQIIFMFNKGAELCKKSGIGFGYHNEYQEFSAKFGDKTVYDIILDGTDASLVVQELDIGNCYGGGGRAMDILKAHPGRFAAMHVKDEIKNDTRPEGDESTILGSGFIGTKDIVQYARKDGTSLFVVEQESYQDKTPIEACKIDYEMMKTWGF